MYDIAIIGAGVIGTAIARELSKYKTKVVILERDNDISTGTTKANSAIVHAGYDAKFGTNKGKFNALGNEMFEKVCKELDVPFDRIGSLVVGFEEEDRETLQALLENGQKLGIPGLRIIEREEVEKIEPNISDEVKFALHAATAGITEPWELAIAYAENAIDNGAELKLNFDVKDISKEENSYKIKSEEEEIEAKYVINCAGVYADKIYEMVTNEPEFKINPRRGQYYLLDKSVKGYVNSVIFPCPSKMGKGVLVTPTVDGNILVGPDSEDLGDKEQTETSRNGLDYVRNCASKTVKGIPFGTTITTFAGLRAEPSTDDFVIEESTKCKNFINVAGIKSPGLSSAPAIGVYVSKLVSKLEGGLKENENFNPIRRPRIKFEELSNEEKAEIIKKDPAYGRIICRCEMITEGEIIDAINRPAGGRTINGIKRRVRPGAGRCQGGFCGPRVMEILARELNIDITEIVQENKNSKILTGETK